MPDIITLQLTQRGMIALPKLLLDQYNLHPGDELTFLDLGSVFVLSPHYSEVDALANQLAGELAAQGETLEGMLVALREAREKRQAEEI